MKNFATFKPTKKFEVPSDDNTDTTLPELSTSANLHPDIPWLSQKAPEKIEKDLNYYQDIVRNKFILPRQKPIDVTGGTPARSNNPIVSSILNSDYSDEDKNYLLKLGYRESTYNPKADNHRGYYGLYQFGKDTLSSIGLSLNDYLNNVDVQHEAALRLARSNEASLKREISKYVGTTFNGINITKNGIRAAAHLLGMQAVKKFFAPPELQRTLYKNVKLHDGNGTPITEYLKLFE